MSDVGPILNQIGPYFEKIATNNMECGNVVLLRRRKDSTCYCEEVLYVRPKSECAAKYQEYIQFHRSYVNNRVNAKWPHKFSLLYDIRGAKIPTNLASFMLDIAKFVSMHSSFGDVYLEMLENTVIIVDDVETVRFTRGIFESLGQMPARPIVYYSLESDCSLAMNFCKVK